MPNAKLTELQDAIAAARKAGDANIVQQQKRIVIFEDVDAQGLFVTHARTSISAGCTRHPTRRNRDPVVR
jgi:hypothetical protein